MSEYSTQDSTSQRGMRIDVQSFEGSFTEMDSVSLGMTRKKNGVSVAGGKYKVTYFKSRPQEC